MPLPKQRKPGELIRDNLRVYPDGSLKVNDKNISLKAYLKEWHRLVKDNGNTHINEDGSYTVCIMTKTVQEKIEQMAVIPHCA